VKTFLSSAPAVEAFCNNISKCLYFIEVPNFSARDVAREMLSAVSSALYSLKTNAFFTMSGVKTTNCIIEDHFSYFNGNIN